MEKWYLLMCKPRQEERVHTNLNNQGVSSFYPKLSTEKILKGRRTLKQTALFPNYLFVCVDSENGPFAAVKNTRGVASFVRCGAKYQPVPNALIHQLKQERAESSESRLPKTGEVVGLTNASFNNIDAIYQQPDGDMRSILLINLLNRQVTISVDNKDIAANG
ncbi:transcription/translation regulatory transformer protein RfaH [Colwellia sp. MB02u-18]|uniref:transcription/translation regulatory transformer protein RfaH n=1 Tax=unclassified Colwellia TaxID=196834 RepID=UPI0015F3786C|nr:MULTISPECIES: transcription/translation regulatory transformer protein RfaH [unclassified Colwellia]MBA6222874.1 transcription/translation regulatory transformer protein RfaH [Colwellia sp. MB3u-45]MBA6267813.1 transcription/translation regulatory transformer protein RfaH [Colwellia sp. MB3u-43]MBA6322380.1 transcription/translation regulatory transformer protein RfaH [Colwellia sp. MB02u-19]MBA6324379.1 transcription/translation regulatory transformer protein RfaH [Colwellia sp. MB02u-18]M